MPSVSAETLTRFAERIFEALGIPPADARVVASSLVGANLRGHDSHGVMRITQYAGFIESGRYQAGVELIVESETPAVVVCDGQWGLGQVQTHRLLDLLVPRAKALGIAAGAGRQFGHIGRLGEYAERVAEDGLILISTVNNGGSGQRVAPPGGVAPRLGTNPICVAVPTKDDPVVLDFGTSVVAEGKVRVHHVDHTPVPEGWLLDSVGRPTTDPATLYGSPPGSIRPMGGAQAYKGFGLALVLDMLAGGLTGGHTCHEDPPPVRGNNVIFIVLDPGRFAGTKTLLDESSQVARYVRNTPKANGVTDILLPGDPERSTLAQRVREGIPLSEKHWDSLTSLAERLQVPVPDLA